MCVCVRVCVFVCVHVRVCVCGAGGLPFDIDEPTLRNFFEVGGEISGMSVSVSLCLSRRKFLKYVVRFIVCLRVYFSVSSRFLSLSVFASATVSVSVSVSHIAHVQGTRHTCTYILSPYERVLSLCVCKVEVVHFR